MTVPAWVYFFVDMVGDFRKSAKKWSHTKMEEKSETSSSTSSVPLSPRPTAFTIDFDDKKVDLQRHKSLAEKFQQRHKRGKSMSKLEGGTSTATATATKKHPLTGNLPRKSSFQSEGLSQFLFGVRKVSQSNKMLIYRTNINVHFTDSFSWEIDMKGW